MHLDAGLGGDGISGLGASCSEALDSPAYLLAVHRGQVARCGSGENAGCTGLVHGGGVFEDCDVSSLSFDDR
jgi:hypothetical protein